MNISWTHLYDFVQWSVASSCKSIYNIILIVCVPRISDVFRGKRRSKRTPRTEKEKKEKCQSVMEPDLKKQSEMSHLVKSGNIPTTSQIPPHAKASFFSSLTSSRWHAKASTSSLPSSSDGLPRVCYNNIFDWDELCVSLIENEIEKNGSSLDRIEPQIFSIPVWSSYNWSYWNATRWAR